VRLELPGGGGYGAPAETELPRTSVGKIRKLLLEDAAGSAS
jgi:N-methylhydantoinase B/oxoprolinase/acetone carboxylase alpha subunit